MKHPQTLFSILVLGTMLISCEKEAPAPITSPIEQPQGVLRAVAGNDTLIYFSSNFDFSLDGSLSVFPPSGPREYVWTQVSGPGLLGFLRSGAKVYLQFMSYGTYVFELKVNNVTAQARDSVTIKVESGWCSRELDYLQAEFQEMSEYGEPVPGNGAVCTSNGRLIIAGGTQAEGQNSFPQDKIHVFTSSTGQWSTAKMSSPRYDQGIAANDRIALIAGGRNEKGTTDVTDIYEFATGKISSAKLSRSKANVHVSIINNKAYLAGGSEGDGALSNRLDIFDIGTGALTTATMPDVRYFMDATVQDDKIFYSGGIASDFTSHSSEINVYHVNTGSWSRMQMRNKRYGHSGQVIDQKLFLLGGFDFDGWESTPQNNLELVDLTTSSAELECLRAAWSLPFNGELASTTVGKNLYYLSNSMLTRYDHLKGKWYVSKIPPGVNLAGIYSDGTRLMGVGWRIAPGYTNGYFIKIYRIAF